MVERSARERHAARHGERTIVADADLAHLHAHRDREAGVELAVRDVREAAPRALERALGGVREARAAVQRRRSVNGIIWFASATASGKIQRARGMPSERAVATEQKISPAA